MQFFMNFDTIYCDAIFHKLWHDFHQLWYKVYNVTFTNYDTKSMTRLSLTITRGLWCNFHQLWHKVYDVTSTYYDKRFAMQLPWIATQVLRHDFSRTTTQRSTTQIFTNFDSICYDIDFMNFNTIGCDAISHELQHKCLWTSFLLSFGIDQ